MYKRQVYNNGSEAVSLKGWGLTDDTEKPLKWKFPDITLAPGQYTLVYCSGLTNLGNMHTNFRISGAGEVIGLFNSSEELVDRVYVSDVPTNMSVGRQSGSDGFFYFQTPTPSTANAGGAIGFAVKPTITTEAGSYRGAQQVTMEAGDADTTIHYLSLIHIFCLAGKPRPARPAGQAGARAGIGCNAKAAGPEKGCSH